MSIEFDPVFHEEVQIARGLVPPEHVPQLETEFDQLWSKWPVTHNAAFRPNQVRVADNLNLADAVSLMGPLVKGVVEKLELPEDAEVSMNLYQPHARSTFHRDYRDISHVLHANRGRFLFAPHAQSMEQAERSAMQLTVVGGDLVRAHTGVIFHSGGSFEQVRKNVTFFTGPSKMSTPKMN